MHRFIFLLSLFAEVSFAAKPLSGVAFCSYLVGVAGIEFTAIDDTEVEPRMRTLFAEKGWDWDNRKLSFWDLNTSSESWRSNLRATGDRLFGVADFFSKPPEKRGSRPEAGLVVEIEGWNRIRNYFLIVEQLGNDLDKVRQIPNTGAREHVKQSLSYGVGTIASAALGVYYAETLWLAPTLFLAGQSLGHLAIARSRNARVYHPNFRKEIRSMTRFLERKPKLGQWRFLGLNAEFPAAFWKGLPFQTLALPSDDEVQIYFDTTTRNHPYDFLIDMLLEERENGPVLTIWFRSFRTGPPLFARPYQAEQAKTPASAQIIK